MDNNRVPSGSPDLTQTNIEKMKELFPEIITEGKIDFDMLKTVLGEEIDDRNERYKFEWHGKKESLLGSQKPSKGTLRPDKEASKNFDTTENLYIEGDNLEVLKLLQKSYNGKVKMIYIDPPYNTGNDFVYEDDFKDNIQNYLEQTGQVDREGNKVSTNTETSGKKHTNWLNMMYPRLKLAKSLLSNDGVLYISINDKELDNLIKISKEIYGEQNILATLIWQNEGNIDNQKRIKTNHEYILMLAKDEQKYVAAPVIAPQITKDSKLYNETIENSITKNGPKNPPSSVTLPKGFPCELKSGILHLNQNDWPNYDVESVGVTNNKIGSEINAYSGWSSSSLLKDFIENNFNPVEDKTGLKTWFSLTKNGTIYMYKKRGKSSHVLSILQKMGTVKKQASELEEMNIYFDYPKPVSLVKYLMNVANVKDDDIILDFFSGSATTAHSVMELNTEKNNRKLKFIMVQLPEVIEEGSKNHNLGYSAITDLGKERIRRAGEKIIKESPEYEGNLDNGFKVLKLDKSNIREWNVDFEDLEGQITSYDNMFVPDRTELDVVYEIMLKYGLELTYQVNSFQVNGKNIYDIAFGNLFICLDKEIDTTVAQAIIDKRNEYGIETSSVVFADHGFHGNDSEKLNCFKLLEDAGYQNEQLMTI